VTQLLLSNPGTISFTLKKETISLSEMLEYLTTPQCGNKNKIAVKAWKLV
jgi:hypothetical protein